jgi:hypothetical protein
MVAIDTEHPEDERHPALQLATRQLLSIYSELRLMCISVVRAAPIGGSSHLDTTTGRHLEHKMRLRQWVEPLGFPPSRISLHVIEGANAGSTLLELARVNHVDLIVLGAPGVSERALACGVLSPRPSPRTHTAASTSCAPPTRLEIAPDST